MSQSRRHDPQHEGTFPASGAGRSPAAFRDADLMMARWAIWIRWWRGRWRSWQAIIRLLPVAGPGARGRAVGHLLVGRVAAGVRMGAPRGRWGAAGGGGGGRARG